MDEGRVSQYNVRSLQQIHIGDHADEDEYDAAGRQRENPLAVRILRRMEHRKLLAECRVMPAGSCPLSHG